VDKNTFKQRIQATNSSTEFSQTTEIIRKGLQFNGRKFLFFGKKTPKIFQEISKKETFSSPDIPFFRPKTGPFHVKTGFLGQSGVDAEKANPFWERFWNGLGAYIAIFSCNKPILKKIRCQIGMRLPFVCFI